MTARTAAALGLVALLTLAGCSGDPEPKFADPTSEAPEPTSEPVEPVTSVPTTEPVAQESAKEFIRRWHEVGDAMQLSGDTSAFRELNQNCEQCDLFASSVDKYYGAGGSIEFDGTRIVKISRVGRVKDIVEFDVERASPPTRFRETADSAVKTIAGGADKIRMRLLDDPSGWLVIGYSRLAS